MSNDGPKKQRVHKIDSNDILDEESAGVPVETLGSPKAPCSIQGLTSALGGGALGYVFGFGRSLAQTRKLTGVHKAGMESGSTFAIFGGVYAAAACFMSRLRQKDDFWNGGMAGCVTGVAVSWQGGPMSALQSCIGVGVFSAVLEILGREPAAEARPLSIYHNTWASPSRMKVKKRRRNKATQKWTELQAKLIPCRQCRPGFWFWRRT